LDTPEGELQLRAPGLPAHGRGEEISWSLERSWPLPGD